MTRAPAAAGERFDRAVSYARQLHAGQRKKGTAAPYLSHLLGVAALVLEHGGDEDEAIAALLHDGPEDQGGEATLADIRRAFGDRVGDIVREMSDSFETPKPAWRPRKERFLARLESADRSTLLVALADKVHNCRSTVTDLGQYGPGVWDRFSASPAETLWYYRSLVDVFRRRAGAELRPLVAQLERWTAELEPFVG